MWISCANSGYVMAPTSPATRSLSGESTFTHSAEAEHLRYHGLRMELLADLDAFYLEHRRCGELELEVSEGEPSWIKLSCTCGAELVRHLAGEEFLER